MNPIADPPLTPRTRAIESFSIVIPIHDDAPALSSQLPGILQAAQRQGLAHEILLVENGSTDDTGPQAEAFARSHPAVRVQRIPAADYGRALRQAIAACRLQAIVIFNIDFWDEKFLAESLRRLEAADLVIGSKVLRPDWDRRPLLRRWITRCFSRFLRLAFGFRGTDTHGIKALRTDCLQPIADACVTNRSIFDTELVLRAERAGLRIQEIPIAVREIRPTASWSLLRRIPETLWNLARLRKTLR